jgi:hypothetical protein
MLILWKPEEIKAIVRIQSHLLIEHLSILMDITICILILLVAMLLHHYYGQAIDGGGLTNVEGQKRFVRGNGNTRTFNCTQISFRD